MKIKITAISFIVFLASCVDLDIAPTSVLSGDLVYNESGIKAYFAALYGRLPMEDFKYSPNSGDRQGYYANITITHLAAGTGEFAGSNSGGMQRHAGGYWGEGFKLIRQANTLIAELPEYPELSDRADAWIAEAKFIRAYTYFKMAMRFGGLPKIFEPQVLDTNNESTLWVARESHEDTYDFILQDLDEAIADLPQTNDVGRVNRYVAAAIKSRVALHAATTAKYGSAKFPDWEVDGVLLQGIPSNRANDYFKQAWDAAKTVEGGGFELYRGNVDKTANYVEIWEKPEANKENLWLRKYSLGNWVHSWDAINAPPRMVTTYGSRFQPRLDWVELFDGIPLDSEGRFQDVDEHGNYIVYDNIHQLWDGAEPRLRANLLLPGETYRGVKISVYGGVIIDKIDPETAEIKKFSVDNGIEGATYNEDNCWSASRNYDKNPFANGRDAVKDPDAFIYYSKTAAQAQGEADVYTNEAGVKFYLNGRDGPRMGWAGDNNTGTGFHGRKFLDVVSQPMGLDVSTQTWIETRYAEVLLNRAEAAIELAQSGESTYGGANMLQDALECINDVRDRAGATQLTDVSELSTGPAFAARWRDQAGAFPRGRGSFVEAPNRALQILRVERYKELFAENKIYWDLMRWFTFDTQIQSWRARGLFPFIFARGATSGADGIPDGKVIYDAKSSEQHHGRHNFGSVNGYYETIPAGELQNNPLLQRNRNQ
jgi:hypothetical protein